MSITTGRCFQRLQSYLDNKNGLTRQKAVISEGEATHDCSLPDATMFFQDPYLLQFARKDNIMYHGSQYPPHYLGDNVCSPSQPCFLSKPPTQHSPDPCSQVLRGNTTFPYNPHSVFQPTASKPEISDPSPEIIHSLPVYFRVKPTLRTPSGRRCRKSRTVFTDLQLRVLEKTFSEQKYLDSTNRAKVAQILGLNEAQVKTWFQNRRMKWKKKATKVEKPDSSSTAAATSKATIKKQKCAEDSKNETETRTKETAASTKEKS